MKNKRILTIIFSLLAIFYGSNTMAYVIEWQTSKLDSQPGSNANNVSIPGIGGSDSGLSFANATNASGYATAESSFQVNNGGFNLFSETEVGASQDGIFYANSNSYFVGEFIIRAETGDLTSDFTFITVDINNFVETNIAGSEPLFEINGNDLGFDSSLPINQLFFDFDVDTVYQIAAYEYTAIGGFLSASSPTPVVNRQGKTTVAFNFARPPMPVVSNIPNPGALPLFALGLGLLFVRKIASRKNE